MLELSLSCSGFSRWNAASLSPTSLIFEIREKPLLVVNTAANDLDLQNSFSATL